MGEEGRGGGELGRIKHALSVTRDEERGEWEVRNMERKWDVGKETRGLGGGEEERRLVLRRPGHSGTGSQWYCNATGLEHRRPTLGKRLNSH